MLHHRGGAGSSARVFRKVSKIIKEKRMKEKIVIEPWMAQKLGLSGNHLILFAIMWRDSEKGTKQVKNDNRAYCTEMNIKVPTYYNVLRALVDKGYIKNVPSDDYIAMYEINIKK